MERHPYIRIFLNSELIELKGFNGNFKPRVRTEDGEALELEAGSVLVCTGYKEFDASRIEQYGYGRLPDVITSFELEAMLRRGKLQTRSGRQPRYVSIIHCVGSRSDKFHPYCSRVCCTTGLKYAFEVKSALPAAHVANRLLRHGIVRQGLRGLLPQGRRGPHHFPDVWQERPAIHSRGCAQRRLQHAHHPEGAALRRGDRDACRPRGVDGQHGTA